jgi:hypothetical protein
MTQSGQSRRGHENKKAPNDAGALISSARIASVFRADRGFARIAELVVDLEHDCSDAMINGSQKDIGGGIATGWAGSVRT